MKNIKVKSIALLLAVGMIISATACSQVADTETENDLTVTEEKLGETKKDDSEMILMSENLSADIKLHYAEMDEYEYTEPMFGLEPDHQFVFDLGFDPSGDEYFIEDEYKQINYKPIVDIFVDSNLTISIDPAYQQSKKSNKIRLEPSQTIYDPTEEAADRPFYADQSTNWGYANEYFLVFYRDLETGEELSKPLVTIFTIDRELDTPYLEFTKTSNGYASYSWDEVEGAESYVLMMNSKNNNNHLNTTLATTTDTSFTDVSDLRFTDAAVSIANMFYLDSLGMSSISVYAIDAEGNYSLASNPIYVDSIKHLLPNVIVMNDDQSLLFENYGDVYSFVPVQMCDESKVDYSLQVIKDGAEVLPAERDGKKINVLAVPIKARATDLTSIIYILNFDEDTIDEDLDALEERLIAAQGVSGSAPPPSIEIGGSKDDPIKSQVKDDGKTDPNDDEKTGTKDDGKTDPNDDEKTGTKDDGKTDPDDDEKTSTKDDEKTGTNDDEKTGTNDDEKTGTNDDEKTGTNDDEKTGTNDDEKTGTNDDEKTGTNDDEKTGTNDDEKTGTQSSGSGKGNAPFSSVIGEYTVYGSNSLTAYIAYNMLNGVEFIDLSDFPEASSVEIIADAYFEAIYQNPLVLGIYGMRVFLEESILMVGYKQDTDELFSKQKEIIEEVDRVVQNIIKPDMSDIEKEMTINEYLCDSAKYDTDALDNALENDMIPDISFKDSFTPYGILVKKVGVCASYASSFKLLADKADLDSVVITGYLNGDLAHAWNRVLIEDEWLSLDVTNNDNPMFINTFFNLSDTSSKSILVEDDRYILDQRKREYTATTDEYEYYRLTNNFYDQDEVADAMATQFNENKAVLLRTNTLTTDEWKSLIKEFSSKTTVTLTKDEASKTIMYTENGIVYIGEIKENE